MQPIVEDGSASLEVEEGIPTVVVLTNLGGGVEVAVLLVEVVVLMVLVLTVWSSVVIGELF